MRVTETPLARHDVEAIALYITGDSESAAERFLDRYDELFGQLARFPDVGTIAPFATDSTVRRVLIRDFTAYQVFYITHEDEVCIARVLSTRQDVSLSTVL